MQKLCRSVLFVPGDQLKMMTKSLKLKSDVIVFDLEDSVAPDKKEVARRDLTSFILQHNLAAKEDFRLCTSKIAVRINCPITTRWGKEDARSIAQLGVDVIVLPKVCTSHYNSK